MKTNLIYKAFLSLAAMALTFSFGGCSYIELDLEKEAVADDRITQRVEQIRATESNWSAGEGATIYYVSNNGDDNNSGTSPDQAIKTVRRMVRMQTNKIIKAGDVVLFERGGEWRGRFSTIPGVTYSAYGEGAKPIINANEHGDAADPNKWELVEGTKNIWKYKEHIPDVGNIIFNNGDHNARRLELDIINKQFYVNATDNLYDRQTSFYSNEMFTCEHIIVYNSSADIDSPVRLFLRCDQGNPGDVYDSIELAYKGHGIRVSSNNVIDNLCVKYAGSHGISGNEIENVTIRNCEVGWIGGTGHKFINNGYLLKYGNGIQAYTNVLNFTVDNCYVYQCFDAGITHQLGDGKTNKAVQENVNFINNVVEKCTYNIEYFMGDSDGHVAPRYMINILYKNNVLAYSGQGWGGRVAQSAGIQGWESYNEAYNFVIQENIFIDDARYAVCYGAVEAQWLPLLKNNTYIEKKRNTLALVGQNGHRKEYMFNEESIKKLEGNASQGNE